MANRIQLRRGSAQEWANVNPTLAIGELGIEIDTGRIKIGDGVTSWNSLKYERPLESITNTPNTLVQRDADGNFSAGAITGSLVGNAATATRLANTRQIALTGDVTASATFDGSSNLNLVSSLELISTLPHYDGTLTSSGQYTRLNVDAKGRITDADNPNTIQDYNLDGTVEGSSAQPYDRDLAGIAGLNTTGIITRVSDGNIATRTVTGTAGRISVVNGSGVQGNPVLDLISTTVSAGTYNTPTIAGATQTIKATRFSVDTFGRFTYAEDFPIATATEGSKYPAYGAGTAYNRYDIIEEGGYVYQAIQDISAGAGAPSHTDGSDTGGWRFLSAAGSEQKGLASFAQEDFNVDGDGHVTIANAGVDNTQLQNNQIRFADGNSYTAYELDNELTASTGYRGITTINDLSVNTTGGSPLLECLAANDNVDINTTTSTIFSDITLDKTSTAVQTINRQGSLTLLMDANTASNRFLRFTATNAGAGLAKIEVLADNDISITSSNSPISITADQQISLISNSADVRVEDFYFANNVLSSTNSTIVLDPAGVGDNTGVVQIKGDLLVDGTTVTVNSTTITVDDPILTLGGDSVSTVDDGKDRGIEFNYYDTQARVGFFGWDENYSNANLWSGTGGYRFLYNATNTNEVFTGTDAALIAGNLALTTNTGSTSTTTGTLVVTGGTGISENLYVGGNYVLTGTATLNNTLLVEGQTTIRDSLIINAANEDFLIQNGSAVNKFTVDTDTGNTTIVGTLNGQGAVDFDTTLNVDGAVDFNSTLVVDGQTTIYNSTILQGDNKLFSIKTAAGSTKFSVDYDNGNTVSEGTFTLTGAADLNSTLNVASNVIFESTDVPTITTDGSNNYIIGSSDYGSFRFDGGGYVAGQVLFSSDIYVNGAVNVKDAGSGGTASRVNSLDVRYFTTLGTQFAFTGSYATDTSNNLRVTGGAGIGTDLYVGDDFYVGKYSSGDTIEFQILGENGNTTIGRSGAGTASVGTLTVHGDVTFNRNTYLNGNIDLGNSSADILTVDATSTFNAPVTLTAGQDLSVGGNATISGNLIVNGTTTTVNSTTVTIDDPVFTLGGDTAPSSDDNKDRGIEFRYYSLGAKLGFFGWDDSSSGFRFLENATNSSEVFSGTDADLYAGSLTLSETGTALSVSYNASIGGTLGVTGATTLSSTLAVTGQTTLTGLLDANGGATIDNIRLGVANNNEIDTSTGNLVLDSAGGTVDVQDVLSVSGITTLVNTTTRTIPAGASLPALAGALQVTGGSHFGENVVVNGDLKVYGSAVYQGGIEYQGTQSYSGIIRQLNTTDASSATDQNASISTDGGVSITKSLWVGTNADITGTLTVDSNSSFGGTITSTGLITANAGLTISGSSGVGENLIITDGTTTKITIYSSNGDIDTAGSLTVDGNTTLGDAVGDTLTVNATATFNNADVVGTIRDARRWTTSRTLSFTGDATGSMSVNGSANASAALTLASTGVAAGTYKSVTVDVKGRVTAASNPTTLAGYGITDAQTLDSDLTAIANLSTTGIIARTGTGTAAARSLAVSGIGLNVSNANGVSGNPTITSNATPSNAASTLVSRDASGNFTANVITADLSGNATTATTLETARTINGIAFDGSSNIQITPVYSTDNTDGDATKTAFAADSGRTVDDIFVVVDGLVLAPTAEYTYTDTTTKLSTGGISGQTYITVASSTGLVPGMAVSGTGIGAGAVITTINGLQINLSVANTATTVGNSITFGAVVTLSSAPSAGTNNVSIRYLPLLN